MKSSQGVNCRNTDHVAKCHKQFYNIFAVIRLNVHKLEGQGQREAESSAGGKTKKTESGKRKARRKLGDRALRWVKAKQKQ